MQPAPQTGSGRVTLAGLFARWRDRFENKLTPAEYRDLGRAANEYGASLLAFDIADEGLQTERDNRDLLHIKALALARLGSGEAAREVLRALVKAGHEDQETQGLLARTYKDAWQESGCREDLEAAHRWYELGYQQRPERYWTGINAATLQFAIDRQPPRALAEKILNDCRAQPANPDDYWLPATMAEAQFLLGDLDEAARLYAEARRSAPLGSVLAMWRNAQIIIRVLGPSVAQRIERALRPPKVALLESNWPGDVHQTRTDLLHDGVAVSYSPAASEADLAFLELVQSLDGQTHIVLPYNEEQFVADKLAGLEDRYRAVKAKAHDVIVCSDQPVRSSNLGETYPRDVLHGLAEIRAAQMDTTLVTVGERRPEPPPAPGGGFSAEQCAMIFADAFHFSRLAESQMPAFIGYVMDRAATIARKFRPKPAFENTWGDGLFFVFSGVADAGRFALRLAEGIGEIDRESAGLPAQMSLRIGVHAGPVYKFSDQIIGRENYIGWHVNRAARIEPSTPPGKIYVSEAFAALATLEAPSDFRFDYVGRQELAKNFGAAPLYSLRRRD